MTQVSRKGFVDKNGNKVSLIAKVINAITGHFAGLNNKGEVVDSGYGPSDFAEASHTHGSISDFAGTDGVGASVEVGEDHETQGLGVVKITVKGDGRETDSESVTIHCNNIGNLIRALTAPDSTIQNNDKLALASAVFAALAGKINKVESAGSGNFASLESNGYITDSGVNEDDFAAASHTHYKIVNETVGGKAGVEVGVDGEDGGEVTIFVKKGSGQIKSVLINDSNIANLIRALLDPDSTPTDGSDNLITSQAVYEALNGIVTLSHQHAISDVINLETALAGKLPYINLGLTIENHPDDSTRYPITSAIGTQLDALVSALSSNTPTPCIVTLYTTRQVSFTDPQTNEPSTTTMVTTQKAVAFITVDKTVPSSPAVYIDFPNGYRFTAIKTGNFMDGYSWPDGFLKTPDVFFATLS